MDFNTRYRQLNPAQKRAVDTIDGPVMVVAGPGTGKTELLSVRTANILAKTDALPENILCLTFTESGAAAMRERLIGIIGKDAYRVAIHTFHSFGSEVINQNREYFYQGAQFEPADDLNRYEILRKIFDELDYKNPLASTMNGEYTHQPDASRVISELKRSGLASEELRAILDANEAALDASERILSPLIAGTVSKSTKDALAKVLPDLQQLAESAKTQFEVPPLIRTIADALSATLDEAEAIHPTKPITAWKKRWFVKNEKGEFVFKSRQAIVKLRALTFVYYEYLMRMEQAGLYDYDDMILQVVHAMEVHDELRFNLQEKFLYIMVDEFQDTNLAQMRIVNNLTDNPVNEGRPNVLVVGDDDQAIYSFQGADISNILRFQELFPSTEIIPLIDNYRSVDTVIEESRTVIVQGADRLETRIETLSKELTGHQEGKGSVSLHEATTIEQERRWLVQQVKQDIQNGVDPNHIAILTRRHGEIQSLLPYFAHAGIPVHYERRENVLEQSPVVALELLSRIIVHLARSQHDQANALMPELLAHPAWGIDAKDLWRLSMDAYTGRKLWLEVMATTPRFVDIHAWIVELTAASLATPLEPMLDRMIGKPTDEGVSPSPFYRYFFSEERRDTNPTLYLDYLTALRTIRAKLREYHHDDKLTLESFLHFIALHRRLGTQLTVSRPEAEVDPTAIHLMTAHKSKGLEFECVYIINCVDSMWGERARSPGRMISYPENLPLAFAGDTTDERLRLFYVAMTRAKRQLTMSFSKLDDSGRSTLLASFLSEREPQLIPDGPDTDELAKTAEIAWFQPLIQPNQTLHDILRPTLANYKLSATHLNTFLDVTNGGPQTFLMNNLLHFPSAKSTAASYGSAIHATLQQAHVHLIATGEHKPLEDILHDFEANLTKERLDALDYATYLQKGSEQLQAYLTERSHTFVSTQKAELDFRSQEVVVDDARLTGLIDVVNLNTEAKQVVVSDYKTGKPIVGGKATTDYEKVKLHKYRQQLMFYKLLVEASRDYHTYEVTKGCLEFIEPSTSGAIECMEFTFDKDEMERFKRLIGVVWRHIVTLDLPDISNFEQSYKGLLAFEEALLVDA